MRGLFVAFEGGEAAGKSTQAAFLADRLDAVLTREPGGTPAGRAIRQLFLDPATGALDGRAEALLMAADRAQHVATVIEPALAAGRSVVTDRYLYSSVSYQGHGRGLDPSFVHELSRWATGGLEPDLVVLLDLAVDVARARVAAVAPDRLEAEPVEFHERVRAGFLRQAGADPARWLVVDATAGPESLADRIWSEVQERLAVRP